MVLWLNFKLKAMDEPKLPLCCGHYNHIGVPLLYEYLWLQKIRFWVYHLVPLTLVLCCAV